tara:strand:- start:161 stop:514 length:354 start_codon:yes stop_codon:yes gene_type:complete
MRVKLSVKYPKERESVCKKIIDILELDNEGSFLLYELEHNFDKQNKILALKDEIKKYFAVSKISSFKPNFECKRPYLNIVRSILRKQNYNIKNINFTIKYSNGLHRRTIKYFIFRNN